MQINGLLEAFLPDLKNYCFKLAGTPWDGEDLYQETLIKMIKSSGNLTEHPNPKGYLFKIATNQWRDTLRKMKHEIIESDMEQAYFSIEYSLLETVEVLIALLPFKQAATILLKEYFGFNSREIAEMLDMTNGGVKAALNRGRSTLANLKTVERVDEQTPALLNRMLNGLKSNDFRCVVTTYHLLISRGVKIDRKDKYFSFELFDPDGNSFLVLERI